MSRLVSAIHYGSLSKKNATYGVWQSSWRLLKQTHLYQLLHVLVSSCCSARGWYSIAFGSPDTLSKRPALLYVLRILFDHVGRRVILNLRNRLKDACMHDHYLPLFSGCASPITQNQTLSELLWAVLLSMVL